MIDVTKITAVEIDGINWKDAPDFVDAYLAYGEYEGRELTNEELDWVMDNESDWFYEKLQEYIH